MQILKTEEVIESAKILTTEEVIESAKILTTEEVIESAKRELNAVNPAKQVAELIEKSKLITITGIEDKEGINKAEVARKALKAYRNAIERKRKELKEISLKYGREVDSTAKKLSEPLQKEEGRLEKMLNEVEQKIKEKKEKEERERLLLIEKRTQSLFDLGFIFNGVLYELGTLKATPERIQTATEEEWDKIMQRCLDESFKVAKAKKQEEERIKAIEEENARLKAIEEENARFKAIEEENARLKAQLSPLLQEPAPVSETVQADKSTTQFNLANEIAAPDATLSASELHLQSILNNMNYASASHYKAGFREGIKFMKGCIFLMFADASLKSRGEVKDKLLQL